MVALLHPQPTRRPSSPSHLRLVEGPVAVKSPLVQWIEARPRRAAVGVLALLAVFGSFLALRSLQAVPPSAFESGPASAVARASFADGEAIHVVQQGETLWAIASDLAPGADPRPLIDRLADRNGGSAIQVGQRLVIPSDLVE